MNSQKITSKIQPSVSWRLPLFWDIRNTALSRGLINHGRESPQVRYEIRSKINYKEAIKFNLKMEFLFITVAQTPKMPNAEILFSSLLVVKCDYGGL